MPSSRGAVVLGGGSGIGKSTAAAFLKHGVSVVIADRNDSAKVAEELGTKAVGGAKCSFLQCDITSQASVDKLILEADQHLGGIDFAVNTAGVTGPTVEGHLISDSDWDLIISIDLQGAWRFAKAIITYWRARTPRVLRDDSARHQIWKPVEQRGSLVTVASSLGSEGKQNLAAYCAAKHGVIGLSKSLALENAAYGIRVNTISPGLVFTPLFKAPGYDFEKAKNEYLSDQPMARFAHPDEIASAIYFAASDGASFMTGADWGPDGGSHIR